MPSKDIFRKGYTLQMLGKDLFLTTLAVISIWLFYLELADDLSPQQTQTIIYADVIIAAIFLMDFIYSYWTAPDKAHFAAERWWELPASIPLGLESLRVFRSFQFIRFVRIFQFARLLRGASKFQRMIDSVQTFTEEVRLVYVVNILGIVVVSGALGFHYAEADTNETVNTFLDSLWWSLSSAAGLGAGNIYPTTDAGKIVGMILVLAGIGVISAFAGLVASYVVRHGDATDRDLS